MKFKELNKLNKFLMIFACFELLMSNLALITNNLTESILLMLLGFSTLFFVYICYFEDKLIKGVKNE